jgi:hypothetical protein
VTEIALDYPENLGTDSAISQAAEFPEHTLDRSGVLALDRSDALSFIIGQICADPLRHNQNNCAIIHVHPISPTNELVRSVSNEWTIGIDG